MQKRNSIEIMGKLPPEKTLQEVSFVLRPLLPRKRKVRMSFCFVVVANRTAKLTLEKFQ
jgi:hypothetical protein